MPPIALALLAAIAVLVLVFFYRKSRYYGRIFSDDHYTEVGQWLCSALKLGPIREASLETNTVYQSSAGCGFVFTRDVGERDVIHLSVSQVGNPTTHAVAGRMAFLFLLILNRNHAEADFFYTDSTVHHAVFAKDAQGDWLTNSVEQAISNMNSYQPLPFRHESSLGAG